MTRSSSSEKVVVPATRARRSAGLFSWGNIIAMLPGLIIVPILLFGHPEKMAMIFMFIVMLVPMILWFGVSIAIYIIAKHNPNERVGHFTQQAAYRYYGVVGFIVVVGTFFGTDVNLWVWTWIVSALILVPLSVRDLFLIKKEPWADVEVEGEAV
ncbi:MAG: hypothetical protein P8Y24_04195 [Gammaproteobacteria bacterium]|jgi:hypothetical protein